MKKQFRNAVRRGFAYALCLSVLFCFGKATAQVILSGTTYSQHFDSIANGLPAGWSADTGATVSFLGYDVTPSFFLNNPASNTGWGNTTGRFKNVASGAAYSYFADATNASQLSQSNRALGIRQNAALDKGAGFVFTIAHTLGYSGFQLSFDLQSLDSGANRLTTWSVDYGTGTSPASFLPVTATGIMTTGGNQFAKHTITVDFGNALDNKPGPVHIRIVSLTPTTGTGSRTTSAIDNYSLSWGLLPPPTHIELLATTPAGTAVPLSSDRLTLQYDNLIQMGTGVIELYKAGNTTAVSIPVPSAAVSISDSTATVTGIGLENNTMYYILMPAGTFLKQNDTLPNRAITDTTYWTFSTADTTPPPPPPAFGLLNETFTGCTDSMTGHFFPYSSQGSRTWRCAVSGYTDSSAVSMSGGIAVNLSDTNKDWLISDLPFDLSAMTRPVLGFWQRRRFEGNVARTIRISTNYQPGTDPDNATWSILQVQDMSHDPAADIWTQVGNIELSDFKNDPFYLAFTYACGSTGAYELSYDDIVITEGRPLGITTRNVVDINLKVLGKATAERILLGLCLTEAAELSMQLYDMTGRIIYRKEMTGKAGWQEIGLEQLNIGRGLYIIRLRHADSYMAVKVMVE